MKYHPNLALFNPIDSENAAYILGFIYADGCIYDNKINIRLNSKDENILQSICNIIYPNQNRPLYRGITKEGHSYTGLLISNKAMVKLFKNYGCHEKKSLTIKFPTNLPTEVISHFLRGYFDGDGCINIRKNKQSSSINIIASHEFCKYLSIYLSEKLKINARHINHSFCSSISVVKIDGHRQVKKFLDYIYKDASIYLIRKYERYLELNSLINNIDNKSLRRCIICDEPHDSKGYCYKHYYQYVTKVKNKLQIS